jgi:hypothetical protein
MSILRSNTTSVTRMLITPKLLLSKLSTAQVFASGDHVERSYEYQVSRAKSKTTGIEKFTRAIPVMVYKRFSYDLKEVLTVDGECDFCHPYAHCDYIYNLVPVPNGNSASFFKRFTSGGIIVTHGRRTHAVQSTTKRQ